jgi:3-carboxy-cis,cis-muconate cycloisomerase
MALRQMFASTEVARLFDDAALCTAMVDFERALARAGAACGLIPPRAAAAIDRIAATVTFDAALLASEARRAGTLAIPLVKHLTAHVLAGDEEAARYVHWGATSQDVIDTALALTVRRAGSVLAGQVQGVGDAVAHQVEAHRGTETVARTLLQPATPVPFGWKAAVWLDALTRLRGGLRRATNDAAVLQFGGASGVLASLGAEGDRIAAALAHELDLPVPATPWHGVRDRVARLGAELAVCCGVMGKIGGDVALLMQPEVAEAFEPLGVGRGGSSALPHKRNPVGSMLAREAGLRAPGLAATLLAGVGGEHERGLGSWQSQWWTLGELFCAAGSAAEAMQEVMDGLIVDPRAMRANLDAMRGFVYAEALSVALAPALGKAGAHARVEALCRLAQNEGRTLQEALNADADLSVRLSASARERIFDPASQFGAAPLMIERALAAWRHPGA